MREHRDQVYGLVAPGLEQAGVAAHCILGVGAPFAGSRAATRLKVVGVAGVQHGPHRRARTRFAMKTRSNRGCDNSSYRRLLLRAGNRLVGAIGFGEWQESRRVQESAAREVFPLAMATTAFTAQTRCVCGRSTGRRPCQRLARRRGGVPVHRRHARHPDGGDARRS